ncbi:hypothetical protein ZOSMA_117G00190 [Zostera marina]|uniref:Pentatricopeptide repeat-containing protein n=1 Tax=Zostera marina TaxID=29655 RepID=A0A0K9Q1N6_ZOSMR|nr:hypothetical protein ZOSMA_117G00190 [Zostera marina]
MTVDDRIVSAVNRLRSCTTQHFLRGGQQLHIFLLKSGLSTSLYYGNCLLHMYSRCSTSTSNLIDARFLFDEMPKKNIFTWNILIDAYSRYGDIESSMNLFRSMPDRNPFTWNAVITGCIRKGDVMFAQKLFDEMPIKNVVALNSVMHGFVKQSREMEALRIYKKANLGGCDSFVTATALNACARDERFDCGKQVHARLMVSHLKLDSILGSALVDMYCKCGDLHSAVRSFSLLPEIDEFSLSAIISGYSDRGRCDDARQLFDRGTSMNAISSAVLWNSMLNCYVSNGRSEKAFELFKLLMARQNGNVSPDPSTLISVLNVCIGAGRIGTGRQVHGQVWKLGLMSDIIVGTGLIDLYNKHCIPDDSCKVFSDLKEHDTISMNAMIHVYSNSGRVSEAEQIFLNISNKTMISWNSMLVGYNQNGRAGEAMKLFREMHRLHLKKDTVTISTVLSSCGSTCSLEFGEQIFALATTTGLNSDTIITTSLIDLYCKAGLAQTARKLFDSVNVFSTGAADEATWNSMLMGYAMNGHGPETLDLFKAMRTNPNLKPNDVTFIGVLTGCCHCGLVEEGRRWFNAMENEFNIVPSIEHYSCMVDLFIRAGRLNEAVDFSNVMPAGSRDAGILTTLLRGCVVEGGGVGQEISERLTEMNGKKEASWYVELSNQYASRGNWVRSEEIRKTMRERSIVKDPGCSWINV